ncbi:MAG TPA: tRNA lysidine(34) synthetase TilS [Burkholderiales bacterium]|nr:tRNA lysidine(34) synthetase TilS [Burkholderiales bacterium]
MGGVAALVAAQLKDVIKPSARLVVGLSGGVDSVVLLDCLKHASRALRFRLAALHVNHQLNPNAARWSAFCRRLCRARGIPFESVTVTVRRGDGPEAAARAARYDVFTRQDCDFIALAHHRDDQVETVLIQLLRGAGVKGLAAMPFLRREEGRGPRIEGASPDTRHRTLDTRHSTPGILRPLLDATREEILEYAKQQELKWIEDESNADVQFGRNYLRHEVLPAIARRFPSYRAAIARSARHLAEAADILDAAAAADGAGHLRNGTLAVEGLRRLPAARARNLLRWFLAGHGVAMPATERLDEALRQMIGAKQDARVAIGLKGAKLQRYKDCIHVVRAQKLPRPRSRRWRGEKCLELPEFDGTLSLKRSAGRGISLARLEGRAVTVRLRSGGERLQPDCRRPRRSLKNLLQELGMPPWRRERLPLIYCGERLVWAAGIGVDCAFQAQSAEPALFPEWLPSG